MVTNLIVKSNGLSSVEFLPEKCKFQKIRIIILSKSRFSGISEISRFFSSGVLTFFQHTDILHSKSICYIGFNETEGETYEKDSYHAAICSRACFDI